MKKKVVLVMVLILLGSFIFAEGQQAQNNIPPFDPDKEYTISIGGYGGLQSIILALSFTEDFEAKYSNIHIELDLIDEYAHHDRLIKALEKGEATNDIEVLGVEYISKILEFDGLTDLGTSPFWGQKAGKGIIKVAMDNATTREGRLIAMPLNIDPVVIFYRKSIADQAGVDFDKIKTWDEFIEGCQKLQEVGGGDFLLPKPDDLVLATLNYGVGVWFNRKGRALMPRDKFLSRLNLASYMKPRGIDGQYSIYSNHWLRAVYNGNVPVIVSGSNMRGYLEAFSLDGFVDWRMASLPENSYSFHQATYLAIPSNVPEDKKAAAWELIKYFTTTEAGQLTFYKFSGKFPVLQSVYDDPSINRTLSFYGDQNQDRILVDTVKHIPRTTISPYDYEASAVFIKALEDVMNQNATPEKAYDKALKDIQALAD
ncbi:extracellular solute-binding protein [Spirochaeta cellobiosiphila]|uniref:extracellular solute-binding protein n=1 Tax=Spirochaeta cellobiosiphila TaxID=504483 RepID=UPI00041129B4|nr:extracellular solute-binding protein [Spirochaeta cellobiosiphila]